MTDPALQSLQAYLLGQSDRRVALQTRPVQVRPGSPRTPIVVVPVDPEDPGGGDPGGGGSGGGGDTFEYGVTEPYNPDPLNPPADANVGWDGTVDLTMSGDQTLPANTTWTNRVINGNVTYTDGTSVLQNCLVKGSAYANNKPGLTKAANGGVARRCTIWGTPTSVSYFTNGIHVTGGTFISDRNVIVRVNDCIHANGANTQVIETGSLGGRFAFFSNDADHASDVGHPYWTHNDFLQVLTASSKQHIVFGSKVEAYFDTTGVIWSGGAFGSGTASGGEIGMPADALNAGFWRAAYPYELAQGIPGRGTWANGISFTNQTGHRALINRIWIDGVNASSGMIQFTVGTANQPVINGIRAGLGGKRSGSGNFYIVSYPVGTAATIGSGPDVNVYADLPSVPVELRGAPLTFTAGGAKHVL
jgi:hypothetical protein